MLKRITFLIAIVSFLTGCHEAAHAQRDYGRVLQKQKKYKQAVAFYCEAIRLDAKDALSYMWRAETYADLEEWQKALDDCDIAIKLGAPKSQIYLTRADALASLGKPASAMDDLNKAVTLTPGNARALLQRAIVAEKIGLDAVGVEDASKALTLDPSLTADYSMAISELIAQGVKNHDDTKVKLWQSHLAEVLNRNTYGNINYSSYIGALQKRIKSHWHPPKNADTKEAKVRFSVARNGKLLAPVISKTSGNDEVDEAALAAVRETALFDPLPAGAPDKVEVEISFDYNVLK